MPIYEFYCAHCHRLFNFLSRTVATTKTPDCPRCHRADLTRRASSFAISKGRKEEPAATPEAADLPPGFDESRLEQAMSSLARDAESMDENDPRQGARLMREVFRAAGLPVGAGMDEALKRMESGEDPEKVEAEMGDAFDEDPFAAGAGAVGPEPKERLARLRRRLLPPSVDPELYEM
jgi:putative FmdB family regulatory protein